MHNVHEEVRDQFTLVHPSEHALERYVANEMGLQSRKRLKSHLEGCIDCRKLVAKSREVVRRYRDLERAAITRAGAQCQRWPRVLPSH
jgi:hypothetical protein